MLDDREYMRQSSGRLKLSATVFLLVANIVIFILQHYVTPRLLNDDYLALSLAGLKAGFVWQLLTFQFLHANWLHLFLNSLALFFFGLPVESFLGRVRFLQVYFASGIAGGLVQMLLALTMPQFFDPHTGVVGASAGLSGLIAAFAVLNWENRFTLLIYFFPVNMRGRTLLWVSLAVALFGVGSSIAAGFLGSASPSQVAHGAHLGGLLAGLAFLKLGIGARPMFWRWRPFKARQRKRELVKAASIRAPRWPVSKPDTSADLPEEEFISREVDPILDKISTHGIQSLTERERRILEAARNRMAKR